MKYKVFIEEFLYCFDRRLNCFYEELGYQQEVSRKDAKVAKTQSRTKLSGLCVFATFASLRGLLSCLMTALPDLVSNVLFSAEEGSLIRAERKCRLAHRTIAIGEAPKPHFCLLSHR